MGIRIQLAGSLLAMLPLFASAQAVSEEPGSLVTDDPAVIASRGGIVIGFDEVDGRIIGIPQSRRAGYLNDPERIEKMLQNMLMMKQLAKDARAAGVDQHPVIKAEIELAVEEILAKRQLASELAKIEVPDLEPIARERYDADPSLYDTGDAISVRHFVIKRDAHGDAAARALAEKLRAEYLAKGGDFEAFVKQHSEEPRAELHGGLLKSLVRGKTVGKFEEAAFGLAKEGELSEVIGTEFGYHVIRLEQRTPSRRRSFDEVKDGILATVRADYISRQQAMYLEQLNNQPLTANPDNVLSLRTRFMPDGPGLKRLAEIPGAVPADAATQAAPAAEPAGE